MSIVPVLNRVRTAGLLLVLVLLLILAHAEFVGQVLGIIDGNSIRVMHDGKAEQIREKQWRKWSSGGREDGSLRLRMLPLSDYRPP